MIFIYAIILGILLLILDFVVVKFSKEKFSIIGTIENAIDKVSGENIWIRLLIVLGTPFLFVYLAFGVFLEDSFGYWVFLILGLASFGYLGASWIETNDFFGFSLPPPKKAIKLFIIGIGLWILVGFIGNSIGLLVNPTTSVFYALPGWVFVIWAIVVWRARDK